MSRTAWSTSSVRRIKMSEAAKPTAFGRTKISRCLNYISTTENIIYFVPLTSPQRAVRKIRSRRRAVCARGLVMSRRSFVCRRTESHIRFFVTIGVVRDREICPETDGKFLMLWSSLSECGYAIGMSVSDKGIK